MRDANIGVEEETSTNSEDDLYAALFDPRDCKATAPSDIGPYASCPTSNILQSKLLAAADTHEMSHENDKESYFQHSWTPSHDKARKQATAELVRCGVLKDEYAGARELAIHHRSGPVKGADDKLSILIPTTRKVHLIFLRAAS